MADLPRVPTIDLIIKLIPNPIKDPAAIIIIVLSKVFKLYD